jgi:vacuolar-type H+-ATPase subunit F/Vma7
MGTAGVGGRPEGALAIAVLADLELTQALRLAGIHRTRALDASAAGAKQRVRDTLREWLDSDELGLIIIGTGHAALVSDDLDALKASKRLLPVIIEVPSRDGAWQADSTRFYQALSRKYLGLEIVLDERAPATADGQENAED